MSRLADKVIEIRNLTQQDQTSGWVVDLWTRWNNQRSKKIAQWSEVENYLFAVDTTTTSNKTLPWTHTSTVPKLTQIRDNLHSNYISALFPNDKWLTWAAFNKDAAKKEKSKTITSYMENKTREGGFRKEVSKMLYDYIDYGNVFAMPTYETRYKETERDRVASFIGPKAVRISPYDIVFDATAATFENTAKVVRSMMTLGSMKKLAMTNPEDRALSDFVTKREALHLCALQYSATDWAKALQYSVDGFGSMQEYYVGDMVELLEFFGDYHDEDGVLHLNKIVTIADRCNVIRIEDIPTYSGKTPIRHCGWRLRHDNLWAMGPLDNLVGMQYMIDHYANMVANALDLKVMPPKKIIGDVEAFVWGPNAEIHLDENGDVQELAQGFGDVYAALEFIQQLEHRMEMYAGAPREAMGIRTPGEKTAFEVQALENAAGRIFQEKIVQFELFMEDLLNDMLESAHRNMDMADLIRVVDNDLGVQQFQEVTKEDITANGVLRPIGARHFAQKAQELQNLVGVFNSPIGAKIDPHTSGVGLAEFINDLVNLRSYNIFGKNIAVAEQQELQALANQAQEDNIMREQINPEEMMLAQAEGRLK